MRKSRVLRSVISRRHLRWPRKAGQSRLFSNIDPNSHTITVKCPSCDLMPQVIRQLLDRGTGAERFHATFCIPKDNSQARPFILTKPGHQTKTSPFDSTIPNTPQIMIRQMKRQNPVTSGALRTVSAWVFQVDPPTVTNPITSVIGFGTNRHHAGFGRLQGCFFRPRAIP